MNNIVLKSFYNKMCRENRLIFSQSVVHYSESLNYFVFTLNIIDDYVYYNIVNNSERNKQHMQKKTFLEEFKRIVLKK